MSAVREVPAATFVDVDGDSLQIEPTTWDDVEVCLTAVYDDRSVDLLYTPDQLREIAADLVARADVMDPAGATT